MGDNPRNIWKVKKRQSRIFWKICLSLVSSQNCQSPPTPMTIESPSKNENQSRKLLPLNRLSESSKILKSHPKKKSHPLLCANASSVFTNFESTSFSKNWNYSQYSNKIAQTRKLFICFQFSFAKGTWYVHCLEWNQHFREFDCV